MATTSVPTNARVIKWEREFYREYIRANRFSKYMGSDESSPIQVNEELTKNIGEQINFELVNRLSGNQNTSTGAVSGVTSGVTGYNTLEGNEEAASIRNFRLTVNRTRWAVVHDGLDEQFSAIDLVEAKRALLMDWFKENVRDRIITALGSISTDGSTHVAYASALTADKNTWNVNNVDRVLYGNAVANYNATHATALANVDTTNDTFTGANLRLLKDVAKSASPKIRPIKVNDEEEYYVCFTGTKLFRQLQTDLGTLNQALVQGGESRKDNPIFTSGDLMYDGIVIREIPEIASLGAVGASSALVMPAYLCGAQSIAYGIAHSARR
jgi:N4-gp56 family major capsid protein